MTANTKYSNSVLEQISRDTHNHFGNLKITEVIKDTVLPEYLGDVNSDSAENLYLKFKKLIEREENPDIYIDKIILEFCNPIRDINRMTDNTKLIEKINRLLRVINLTINDNATEIIQNNGVAGRWKMEVSGKTTVVKWDRSIGYTFSSKTILARLMHLFKDSKHISFSRIQKEIKEWTDLDDNKIFERIEGQKINKYINENCKFNLTFKKNLNSVELISSKKKK